MLVEPQALYAAYRRKALPWDFIGRRRLMAVPVQPMFQGFGGFGFWDEMSTTTKLVLTGVGGVVVGALGGYLVGRRRG
jgi:hypothetical protein